MECRAATASWGRPANVDTAVRDASDDEILWGIRNGVLEANRVLPVCAGLVAVGAAVIPTDLGTPGEGRGVGAGSTH